jgi:chromosome segregation ATPase
MKEATDLKADNQKLKLKADLRNRKSVALQESANEKTAAMEQENEKLTAEVSSLKETNASLEASNKKFEKKYSILVTRYKELADKLTAVEADKKKFEEALGQTQTALNTANEEYNKLKETAVKVAKVAKSTKVENAKVKEQVRGLLSDSPLDYGFYEGVDHNRMKGFVNFRENHGVEIEDYWNDLVQKYGEAIMPFENRIRGAKTLSEAHSQFLFNINKIDENAAKAEDMLMDPAVPQSFRETVNASNGYVEETAVTEDEADARFRNSLPKGWI